MIQLQVLNKVLSVRDMGWLIEGGIDISYFSDYVDEFLFISNHEAKYDNVPDQATFLEKFPEFNLLDVAEGETYLLSKLVEDYTYRQMARIFETTSDMAQDDSVVALENLQAKAAEVLASVSSGSDVLDIIHNPDSRLDEVEAIIQGGADREAIPTGFDVIDELTGGFFRGEDLWAIVARPGIGKSWLLHKMAAEVWKSGKDVLLYSGEMSARQVGFRVDTLLSHVNLARFRDGKWTDKELDIYNNHIEAISESTAKFNVFTPDSLGGKWLTVQRLDALISRHNPDVVFLDQLSLMDDLSMKGEQLRIKYAKITADLFKLSTKYKVPIVLAVQANRYAATSGKGKSGLENIAESDGVGQNASRVIQLDRDHDNDTITLSLIKNRYGQDNKELDYLWDVPHGEFTFIGYKSDDDSDEDTMIKETVQANMNSLVDSLTRGEFLS